MNSTARPTGADRPAAVPPAHWERVCRLADECHVSPRFILARLFPDLIEEERPPLFPKAK